MTTTDAAVKADPNWVAAFRQTAPATWVQWHNPIAGVWVQQGAQSWGAGWWDRAVGRERGDGHAWGLRDREAAFAQARSFWDGLSVNETDESVSTERRLLGVGAEASAAAIDEAYQRRARAARAAGQERWQLDELRRAYETVREELRSAESMDRKVRAASERERRQEAELERRREQRQRERVEQARQRRADAEQRRHKAEQRRRRQEAKRRREAEAAEERRRAEDRRRRAEQETGAARARDAERKRRANAGQGRTKQARKPRPARSADPLAAHRQVLAVAAGATREEIVAAHRRLAKAHHPDAGGSTDQMVAINLARDALLEALV